MNEAEQERRLSKIEERIDNIDNRGTRGMEIVKTTIEFMERDVKDIKAAVSVLNTTVATLKPTRNWPSLVSILAIAVPLYALVADLIVRGH